MHQKAAAFEEGYGEEGTESESTEDQDHDLWYRAQASSHVPSVALECAATAFNAVAASTGFTRNAVGLVSV